MIAKMSNADRVTVPLVTDKRSRLYRLPLGVCEHENLTISEREARAHPRPNDFTKAMARETYLRALKRPSLVAVNNFEEEPQEPTEVFVEGNDDLLGMKEKTKINAGFAQACNTVDSFEKVIESDVLQDKGSAVLKKEMIDHDIISGESSEDEIEEDDISFDSSFKNDSSETESLLIEVHSIDQSVQTNRLKHTVCASQTCDIPSKEVYCETDRKEAKSISVGTIQQELIDRGTIPEIIVNDGIDQMVQTSDPITGACATQTVIEAREVACITDKKKSISASTATIPVELVNTGTNAESPMMMEACSNTMPSPIMAESGSNTMPHPITKEAFSNTMIPVFMDADSNTPPPPIMRENYSNTFPLPIMTEACSNTLMTTLVESGMNTLPCPIMTDACSNTITTLEKVEVSSIATQTEDLSLENPSIKNYNHFSLYHDLMVQQNQLKEQQYQQHKDTLCLQKETFQLQKQIDLQGLQLASLQRASAIPIHHRHFEVYEERHVHQAVSSPQNLVDLMTLQREEHSGNMDPNFENNLLSVENSTDTQDNDRLSVESKTENENQSDSIQSKRKGKSNKHDLSATEDSIHFGEGDENLQSSESDLLVNASDTTCSNSSSSSDDIEVELVWYKGKKYWCEATSGHVYSYDSLDQSDPPICGYILSNDPIQIRLIENVCIDEDVVLSDNNDDKINCKTKNNKTVDDLLHNVRDISMNPFNVRKESDDKDDRLEENLNNDNDDESELSIDETLDNNGFELSIEKEVGNEIVDLEVSMEEVIFDNEDELELSRIEDAHLDNGDTMELSMQESEEIESFLSSLSSTQKDTSRCSLQLQSSLKCDEDVAIFPKSFVRKKRRKGTACTLVDEYQIYNTCPLTHLLI
eukprot:g130.t1